MANNNEQNHKRNLDAKKQKARQARTGTGTKGTNLGAGSTGNMKSDRRKEYEKEKKMQERTLAGKAAEKIFDQTVGKAVDWVWKGTEREKNFKMQEERSKEDKKRKEAYEEQELRLREEEERRSKGQGPHILTQPSSQSAQTKQAGSEAIPDQWVDEPGLEDWQKELRKQKINQDIEKLYPESKAREAFKKGELQSWMKAFQNADMNPYRGWDRLMHLSGRDGIRTDWRQEDMEKRKDPEYKKALAQSMKKGNDLDDWLWQPEVLVERHREELAREEREREEKAKRQEERAKEEHLNQAKAVGGATALPTRDSTREQLQRSTPTRDSTREQLERSTPTRDAAREQLERSVPTRAGFGTPSKEKAEQGQPEEEKKTAKERVGKGVQRAGQATELTGKGMQLAGKGTKVAGGALGAGAGGLAGGLAGGIGGVLGGPEGIAAGARAGASAGAKAGKKVGQLPGQGMEAAGKGVEKAGAEAKKLGRGLKNITAIERRLRAQVGKKEREKELSSRYKRVQNVLDLVKVLTGSLGSLGEFFFSAPTFLFLANGEMLYSFFNKNYKVPFWKKILIIFADLLILLALFGVITFVYFIVDGLFDLINIKPVPQKPYYLLPPVM